MQQFIFIYANVVNFLKRHFLYRPNFKILKAELDYVHMPSLSHANDDPLDPFWDDEKEYWDDESEVICSYVNLTQCARNNTVGDIIVPYSISDCVVSIWYLYNEKVYKFFTRNMDYVWPPVKSRGLMKFSLPIRYAELLDEDKKIVADVTEKIKKYAGPHCDFFNQEVVPDDMFPRYEYKYLRIVNIIGKEYTVENDDYIKVPW